jgi:hypothetical protein
MEVTKWWTCPACRYVGNIWYAKDFSCVIDEKCVCCGYKPDGHDEAPVTADGAKHEDAPSGDPKQSAGSHKVSLWHIPKVVIAEASEAMRVGAKKYGAFNWLDQPMRASTYIDAIDRHMAEWIGGRDQDHETKLSPLAHVIASCTILMVQQMLGKLIDDRPKELPSFTEQQGRLLRKRKERKED